MTMMIVLPGVGVVVVVSTEKVVAVVQMEVLGMEVDPVLVLVLVEQLVE